MNPLAALLSVGVVSAIPLTRIPLLRMRGATLQRMLLAMVSFAAGAMLGAAFLHLLPEAAERLGAGVGMALLTLLGFTAFFLHNLLDGMVIAIGYSAGIPAGIATTIAVILHELPAAPAQQRSWSKQP